MPSVHIATNRGHMARMVVAGAPALDRQGRLERSIPLPEEAFQKIEAALAQGFQEGMLFLTDDGSRLDWYLDR
jgi:hypothetical protein